MSVSNFLFFFFFNDTAPPEIYTYGHTLSLPDPLPICPPRFGRLRPGFSRTPPRRSGATGGPRGGRADPEGPRALPGARDRPALEPARRQRPRRAAARGRRTRPSRAAGERDPPQPPPGRAGAPDRPPARAARAPHPADPPTSASRTHAAVRVDLEVPRITQTQK